MSFDTACKLLFGVKYKSDTIKTVDRLQSDIDHIYKNICQPEAFPKSNKVLSFLKKKKKK